MKAYLFLPFAIVKFWYIESPVTLFNYFRSVNHSFFQLFSLPLLLKTYFQPLKNEYREGLVGFSRAMGMIIKSFLIFADTLMLIFLLVIEISIFVSFLVFPIATVVILFL